MFVSATSPWAPASRRVLARIEGVERVCYIVPGNWALWTQTSSRSNRGEGPIEPDGPGWRAPVLPREGGGGSPPDPVGWAVSQEPGSLVDPRRSTPTRQRKRMESFFSDGEVERTSRARLACHRTNVAGTAMNDSIPSAAHVPARVRERK